MTPNRPPSLAVITPCYNEEEVLPETAFRMHQLVQRLILAGKINQESHICFVDDGSKDRSWAIIRDLARRYATIGGVRLSRNKGHQNALLAGLFESDADLAISIDADLQDDLEAIPKMIDAALEGADIVYGVRNARASDTTLKRLSARAYYKLLGALGAEIIYDHADFRLLSRRAIDALRLYGETNIFLRALIPQLGFETRIVLYDRSKRAAGVSKYPLGKMVALAVEGITSFSTRPLRMVTWLGLLLSLFSVSLALWAIVGTLLGRTVPGWASTVIPIYVVAGVQLFSMGLIGEYIGKIYLETKARPRFIVSESIKAGSASPDRDAAQAATSGRIIGDHPGLAPVSGNVDVRHDG
jgi:polyisoprenyl-phosphate glycosyltransferase